MTNLRNPKTLLHHALPVLALVLPASADADSLPKPVSDLGCVVGNWKGSGTFQAGTERAKIKATWNCKRTSAEFGVTCVFSVTGIPGVARYEETDLFGFEPNTRQYHWYSVTNAGETHDHVAQIPTGNSVQFVFNGVQDGKPLQETIDLVFSDDSKSASGRAETFVGGESTSVLELQLKK